MGESLHIRTLGRLSISVDDETLTDFASRKAEVLLVYLACNPRPHPREVLADLLWDDRTQRQAMANLRVVLASLRKVVGTFVTITRHEAGITEEAPVWVDAVALETAAYADRETGGVFDEAQAAGAAGAVALYEGDFLAGTFVPEASGFETWATAERERLHLLVTGMLHDLATFELVSGRYQAGQVHASRLLALGPLHEGAHRLLMTLLSLSNRRGEALAQYERCRRLMDEELGVLPSPETQELHELLLRGEQPPLPEIGELRSVRPPRKVGPCPYRGLSAFREEDAPFFHGREAFVKKLYGAVQRTPLVTVMVGSSGSGKSSVLHAGLLPRLREEGGWAVAGFRPGSHPFQSLAAALLPMLEPDINETERLAESSRLAALMLAEHGTLQRSLERVLEKQARQGRLLVWVDQFEELYTLCRDPHLQRRFVDAILNAVESADVQRRPSFAFLLTMRADFMGQALRHRRFADALQDASWLLGPMTEEELQAAIELPAERQGAVFEVGLVERILDDVGDEPGNLPLLEFALTLLWEQREQGWLTHAGYESIGRVEGALASYADEVYAGLAPAEQEGARRALIQLVRPGEGTEDTRRVATRDELGEENWQLIRHLADKRLVVTDRDSAGREVAEVVHEVLIQRWDRLRQWMESDRDFRTWQERTRNNLHQWHESDRDAGALLSGAPLSVAQQWVAEREEELSAPEVAYIRESLAHQERRQAKRERRRRRTVMALVAGLVITIGLAALAYYQRRNSQLQAAILLAGRAESELDAGQHDRAVLLALEALERFPYTAQAEHALGQAVITNRAQQQYTGHSSAATSVAWSPDGTRVASSAGNDNSVHIWDPATGKTLLAIDLPSGITGNIIDMALSVTWTPDGERLLVMAGDRYRLGSQDFDLLLLDATTGDLLSSVEIPNRAEPASGEITASFVLYPTGAAASIAPGSGRLATLGGDNSALIWDTAWQAPEVVLTGHKDAVNSVAWSPDGLELVTAGMDGTARVWAGQSGEQRLLLEGHEGRVALALWSPDGNLIATAGEDGTVQIWQAGDGRQRRQLEPDTESVWTLAWSPDGDRLVTGHHDGRLAVWDVATGDLLTTLAGHQGLVSDLAWSPVDDRLASSDNSGFTRIWNAAPTTAWRTFPVHYAMGLDWTADGRYLAVTGGDQLGDREPPSFAIWDVVANDAVVKGLAAELQYNGIYTFFSPDNEAILFAGDRGFPEFDGSETVYVLDPWSGKFLQSFTVDEAKSIRSINWSPDGSQVATGAFWSDEILIWDFPGGESVRTLAPPDSDPDSGYNYVAWSPDGSKIAGAKFDTIAPVWDAHSGELLYVIDGHEPPAEVWCVSWSPDSSKLLTTAGSPEMGAKDTTARVWDAETGEQLLVLRGHTKAAFFGYWSPDGRRIVTSSVDNTVRIWDATTGDELLTLSPPPSEFGLLAVWSPDGRYLATTGIGSQASVWRVWQSKEELVEYARECCVFRELTATERQQFGLGGD